MESLKFTIKADNSKEVTDRKDAVILKFLEETGQHLEGESKLALEMDPRRIDTGNLRNSIAHATSGEESAVYVGTNVEYAPYVHEGTYRMAPNRFIRNAFEMNADQLMSKLKEALKSA